MAAQRDRFSSRFKICRTVIGVQSNRRRRLEALDSYLCIPREEEGRPAGIELEFLETEEGEAGRIIPLPGDEYRRVQTLMLLDRAIPFEMYRRGETRWTDLPGFGRTRLDYRRGRGQALFYPAGEINPFYADLLFGFKSLNNLLLKEGFCSIHASCVQIGGQGVLFTGQSGSGKSTAAFALARRGHPLLNDELILLRREEDSFHCFTLSDMVKLRQEALERFFPELMDEKPYIELNGECYYKASLLAGLRYEPTVAARFLVTLAQTGRRKSRIERINAARVVGDLFPVTMPSFNPDITVQKFDILMEFLRQVRCYRVHFGTDMAYFVNLMEEVVGIGNGIM